MSTPVNETITDDASSQTLTAEEWNLAEAYVESERKLSVEIIKNGKEQRKSRRLQSQVNEYIDALNRSTADSIQVGNQYQALCGVNQALSQELSKAKLMVETLEAVIVLLYKTPKEPTVVSAPKTEDATDYNQ